MEEVTARLLIKDKGEIVLQGLSDDSFEYPYHVWISAISGLTSTSFSCDGNSGIDSRINIGKKSPPGKRIGIEFLPANDVIHHYDTIKRFVNSLKKVPEANYLSTQTREEYVFIENKKTT